MKNLLFIATKYSATADNHWLSNDLVQEFANQDCRVTVVALGEEDVARRRGNITENIVRIDSQLKILKYLVLWPRLFLLVLKLVLKGAAFDQVIVFAPVSVMWPAVFLVRFLKSGKKTAVVFDIYPAHQVKIGALPPLLERPLKYIEKSLLSGFAEITAMGERNKRYIEDYYATSSLGCRVKTLNLWGRGVLAEGRQKRDGSAVRVVFGGQIIKGRELNTLIDFFGKMRQKGLPLELDIYSKGPEFEEMKSRYASLEWLGFKDQLPRSEYVARLATYNFGAIVTDKNADLPTFPSKIIDYVEAGIKAYCLVEKESELSTLLGEYSAVYINHFSFSDDELERSCRFFSEFRDLNLDAEIQEMRSLFSVKSAVLRLMA